MPKDVIAYFGLRNSAGEMRQDLVDLAKTAEVSERYEDMCDIMAELVKYLVGKNKKLAQEERNLLSVAFKNVVGARRASVRTLASEQNTQVNPELASMYKEVVEKECQDHCENILSLLEDHLIPMQSDDGDASDQAVAEVFYLKMAGDYYRYLAECIDDESSGDKAEEFYGKAYEKAKDTLPPTHPIRLGLALNYSVCQYEIKKKPKDACALAKQAFDDAISQLDKLAECDYKDSTLIMQLLRDNLTLWTSGDMNADDEEDCN